jgi:endoglucanase
MTRRKKKTLLCNRMLARALTALGVGAFALQIAQAQTVAPVLPIGVGVQSQIEAVTPPAARENTPAPAVIGAPPSSNAPNRKPLALDARPLSLGGALKSPELWQSYKARFVTESGRVLDTGNGMISHSEGQGYAMVLAVAANDRATFDRLWGWTRANLMVRDDQLIAWRWEPNRRPAIADINNASDGDILIAWALAEAAELWGDVALKTSGRRVAVEVGRKLVVYKTKLGALLLPAVSGFAAEDRPDGPIVNPSYWVFPAFARLPLVAPEIDWRGIAQSGLDVLKISRFGSMGLPAEWVSLKDGKAKPADGFPSQFGYNSIRIPLYMAWAGIGERDHYDPFVAWAQNGRNGVMDVKTGVSTGSFGEGGYSLVGALALCAAEGQPLASNLISAQGPENYYPATLRILSILAAQMRYPACLRG